MSTEIREAIEAADAKFVAAFNGGDAAGVAALYAEEGQLLPPNADFVKGKGALQAFWQAGMDMGLAEARLSTLEAEAYGDTAIEVGKYTLYLEGNQEADTGKYLVVWKDESGNWKLHRDIWNSSKSPG